MPWIDGHLDLAYLAVNGRDLTRPCPDGEDACISLPALRAADFEVVLGTIFTAPGSTGGPEEYADRDDVQAAWRAGDKQFTHYEELESAGEIRIVRAREELTGRDDVLKVVILMEGADPIRSPADVAAWFNRGLRLVGLTWAVGTRYAGGNADPHGPLTEKGRELVPALDEFGIVHDLSHLSDEAADDLLGLTRGRIVATHSNCRALLSPDQRHLRDAHLREIAVRGGIVGLNLYTKFLAEGRRATVHDAVRHLEHAAEVMGDRRHLALGSDMDGGFGPSSLPVDLDHPGKLGRLAEALAGRGWSESEIAGLQSENWRRFLMETLPDSEAGSR